MNYDIKNLPERTSKPRQYGFTMAMDKGLSIREAEDFISLSANHVDIVKLGWGTSYVTPNLKGKLQVYKDAGLPVYFGGTLFEAFVIRDQLPNRTSPIDFVAVDRCRYKNDWARICRTLNENRNRQGQSAETLRDHQLNRTTLAGFHLDLAP